MPPAIETETSYLRLKELLFTESKRIGVTDGEPMEQSVALIAHVCGITLQNSDSAKPFRPIAVWPDGSRTADISDLTAEHLDVLAECSTKTKNPALAARCNDILWIKARPKKVEFARTAIRNYVDLSSMNRLKNIDKLIIASDYLRRAIQLWQEIGMDADLRVMIENEIKAGLDLYASQPKDFMHHLFFDLLADCFDKGEFDKWLKAGEKGIADSVEQKNFDKARAYTISMERIYRRLKDTTGVHAMKVRRAELYVQEALELKSAGANAIILQDRYNKAIEACRNTEGLATRAKELHAELVDLQKGITFELKFISQEIDLKPAIDHAIASVEKVSFRQALELIALKALPQSREKIFQDAKGRIEKFPLQSLISTVLIDEQGKIVAKRPGMGFSNDQQDSAIRSQATQDLLFGFEIRGIVIGFAQRELNNRIDVNEKAFDEILYPNPFVPVSRIAQFKKGLVEGLNGDWISSLAILVPLLENSFRNLMQMSGHNMMTIDADNIQQEKPLSAFIYLEEFGQIVGRDMQFQLQVLLTDKTGLNLRNEIAHGLLTDRTALSGAPAFVWALTMLLCLEVQQHFHREGTSAEQETLSEDSEEAELGQPNPKGT